MGFLLWLEEGPLGIFIRESLWGYPIVLSSHAVGMATVMGVVVALNFRVLGYAKDISVLAFDKRGTGRSQGVFTFDFHQLARDVAAADHVARDSPG